MALSLGPSDDQVDTLRPIYLEHRSKFGPDSWAHRFYSEGVDHRTLDDDPSHAVELTAAELPPGCA